MAKCRVTKIKFCSGDTELEMVRFMPFDGGGMFGLPVGLLPQPIYEAKVWAATRLPETAWVRADREVKYRDIAHKHPCNWRCTGAKPGGECSCKCEGRNHSRNYVCEFVS